MRVTMVNKYYPPHIGGVEFHLRNLAEGLVEHQDANVRVIACNGENRRVQETIAGVDIVRLARAGEVSSTPIAWGFARELAREARRNPAPDIFHFHFPYPWGEIGWLTARPDKPCVVSYHSDIVRQKAAFAAYRPLMERFLDAADLIIAGTPNMIENSPYLAARAHKVRHVDYGLHVERIADNPTAVARAEQLRAQHPGRNIVLFVGRLVYYKGADVLVRAMEHVDADLVMVGRGPLESELREVATARGISDRVTFLPPVDDDELAAWYHAADVFALPSVARSEAFGLVQIEAHAAGTPVVSTDLPTGVPYANLDGVTGYTVPVHGVTELADALRTLLADDALRARLGAQAQKRALSDFTVPRMAQRAMEVYAEAIELHAAKAKV